MPAANPFALPAIDNGIPNPNISLSFTVGAASGGKPRTVTVEAAKGGHIALMIDPADKDDLKSRGSKGRSAKTPAPAQYPEQIIFDVRHGLDFVRMIRTTIDLIDSFHNEIVFPDSEMGLVITDEDLDDDGIYELIVTITSQSRVSLSWRKLVVGKQPGPAVRIIDMDQTEAEAMAILISKTHDIITHDF